MISQDQLDSSEFYNSETKKYMAMIRRLDQMQPPSCMVGDNQNKQTQEEIDLYKKIGYNKKNLIIVKNGKGAQCRCGHGRVTHVYDCKKCDCRYFRPKPAY